MPATHRPQFSLRAFFAYSALIAVFCGLGGYKLAALTFVFSAVHFALLLIGCRLADRFPEVRRSRRHRWGMRPILVAPVPVLLTLSFLCIFCWWRTMLIVGLRAQDLPAIWGTPVIAGITFAAFEHLTLATFQIYLLANFFATCYGGRLSLWNCGSTAWLSMMLMACHYGVPHG